MGNNGSTRKERRLGNRKIGVSPGDEMHEVHFDTAEVGPNDHVFIKLGYQRASKKPRGVIRKFNTKSKRWLVKLTNGSYVKVLRNQIQLCPVQKGLLCKLNKDTVDRSRKSNLKKGVELIPCEFRWGRLDWNCLCLEDKKMYYIKAKRLTQAPHRELSEFELNEFLLAKATNRQGQTIYEPIIGEANTHWQKQTEPEEKEKYKLYTHEDWAKLATDGTLDEECILKNIDIMFRGVIGLKKILDEVFSGELPEVISFMLAEFTFEKPERKTSKAALRTLERLAAISEEDSPVHQRVDALFQHSMLAFYDEAGGSDVFHLYYRGQSQFDLMDEHFVRGMVFNYGSMYSFDHVYSKILNLKKLGHSNEFKVFCIVLRVCLQVELKQLVKEKREQLPQKRTDEEIDKSSQEPMRILAKLIFGNTGKEMNQVFLTLQNFMPIFASQGNSFLCYILDELNESQTLTSSQLKRFLSVVSPEMAQKPKPMSVREHMRLLRKKKKREKTQGEEPSEIATDEKLGQNA